MLEISNNVCTKTSGCVVSKLVEFECFLRGSIYVVILWMSYFLLGFLYVLFIFSNSFLGQMSIVDCQCIHFYLFRNNCKRKRVDKTYIILVPHHVKEGEQGQVVVSSAKARKRGEDHTSNEHTVKMDLQSSEDILYFLLLSLVHFHTTFLFLLLIIITFKIY